MNIRPDANRDDLTGTRLWDVTAQRELFQVTRPSGGVMMSNLAFSPDRNAVAWVEIIEGKPTVVALDRVTHELRRMRTNHLIWVPWLAYSPDGKTIATASHDRSIELLDAKTGMVRETLVGHHSGVTTLAFSPDGRTLASGSDTGEVKLWDALSAQELISLDGHTGRVTRALFSPDGTRLATAGEGADSKGEVNLWHAPRDLTIRRASEAISTVSSTATTPIDVQGRDVRLQGQGG